MKRGKGTGFGEWIKAKVQRKGNQARIQTEKEGPWITLKEFPKNLPPEMLSVQFDKDKIKVNGWKPLQGVFNFTTEKFSHRENQAPVPKHKVDKWGNDVYTFVVILEIIDDGVYKGCKVAYNLRAKFEPTTIKREEKEVQALSTSGFGMHTERLEEYLQVTGIWDRDFPYKDNPLPMLQNAVLAEKAVFRGQIEDGWITSLYKANLPTEDTDFTGDDDTPWKE